MGDEFARTDAWLARLSRTSQVIYSYADIRYEMSYACFWRQREMKWQVSGDSENGDDKLRVEGNVPPYFESVRDRCLASHQETGQYWAFDVPVLMARAALALPDGFPDRNTSLDVLSRRMPWWKLWR